MNCFETFFSQNSFIFGERNAPQLKPDNIITILKLGIENYYKTQTANNSNYVHKIIPNDDVTSAFVNPGIGCSHRFLSHYYSSVAFTQLFFEQYIVKLLDSISPIITRKNGNRDDTNFIAILVRRQNESQIAHNNTIQYSKILNRFKTLFVEDRNLPQELKIPAQYQFLQNHLDSLDMLRILRNEVMHSGKRILYYYAYELLFANHVMPVVKELVRIESDTTIFNRNVHCGINVIDTIAAIQLPYDYLSPMVHDQIKRDLNHLNHLKELGRASFNNPLFMGESGNGNDSQRMHWENENGVKRAWAEFEANLIHNPLNYHQTFTCPCCGTKSLMSFEYWIETATNRTRACKANCILCDYTIEKRIGEPMDFGIMTEPVFNYIDEAVASE